MQDTKPNSDMTESDQTRAAIEHNQMLKRWGEMYPNIASVYPHESIAEYCPGGFHPVALGDTFCQERYIIRLKLQSGGFSSVWMARDTLLEQWVSIKIKKARVSFDDPEQDPEIQALKTLEDYYTNQGGQLKQRGFVQLLDCFNHYGPNGRHTCLVMELLGPSVQCVSNKYRNEEDQYRPDTILRASRHLLESIDFAHQAGIAHGDISTTNVVFTCKKPLSWDDTALFETIIATGAQVARYEGSEPKPPNLPAEIIQNAHWSGWFDSIVEDVRLVDWGGSFSKNATCTELPQPRDLRAPETFFIGSFDYTHDLWRAGTVIYDLFYQVPIFLWSFSPALAISIQIRVLGPLPAKWQAKYDEMVKNDKDAALTEEDKNNILIVRTFESQRQKIIERIEANEYYEKADASEEDYQALRSLKSVMLGLLQFEPSNRISAREAASMIQWTDTWQDEDDEDEYEDEQDVREENPVPDVGLEAKRAEGTRK